MEQAFTSSWRLVRAAVKLLCLSSGRHSKDSPFLQAEQFEEDLRVLVRAQAYVRCIMACSSACSSQAASSSVACSRAPRSQAADIAAELVMAHRVHRLARAIGQEAHSQRSSV